MSQQYTSYLPPTATRSSDRQLLLQQQYTDFNVSPSSQQQLVMSAISTEDINRQQQQTHIMQLNNLSKPKRNQVKNACVNCQKACKKCDEGRPCQRCIKYNLAETCQDSVRKERKKGVKRGPYKQTERSGTRKRKEKKAPNSNELKNINMCFSQQQQQQQHQWPVDVKLLEQQSINMSQQNSSVSPKNGKKCEMKHVTQQQPLSSYQKDMSKYIANLQQRQFISPNSNNNNAMMYNNEDSTQLNYSNTTIPSPLSNHNGSNNLNTMSNHNNNTGVPSMSHEQDIDTMYSIYIQNNLQQLHNSNNVSVYGTPTGSPIFLPSQTRELGTLDFVNSTPWETHQATNLHHKFVNNDNNTNWFYS